MRLTTLLSTLAACGIAVLAGCWTPDPRIVYAHLDDVQSSWPADDRALVVLWAEVLEQGPLGKLDHSGDMYFRLKRPVTVTESGKQVEKRWFHYFAGGDLRAAAIPPGDYAIERFQYIGGNYSSSLSATAWDRQTGSPSIFGFSVSAGEVVYLGHLQMILHRDRAYQAALSVSDREVEAREFIREEFGDRADPILAKMQTRLLKVPAEAW